jgi:hypothetical protein
MATVTGSRPSRRPEMAAVATVNTLDLVAEKLAEDADWLWQVSCEMEPEDGCLSILGRNDEHSVAFTDLSQGPEADRVRRRRFRGHLAYRTTAEAGLIRTGVALKTA